MFALFAVILLQHAKIYAWSDDFKYILEVSKAIASSKIIDRRMRSLW